AVDQLNEFLLAPNTTVRLQLRTQIIQHLDKIERLSQGLQLAELTGYEFIASLAEVLVDDEQIDNLRQAYETVKGAPVDMRAELRA
ncbi:hypothetical protein MJO10_30180, partial [Salmonella enterica subsp. enterica serovar Anatum]|nr:hypothetical protein [Salmonella enterica subsp. enterica serovar Anatum]